MLLFLLVTSFVGINGKYICDLNQTIKLESDKVYFIESPDFPRSMNDNERNECSFNFTKELSNGEIGKRFLFVLTNVYNYGSSSRFENFTVFQYQPFYYFNISDYSAFQGYVIYDDWSVDDCHLESVSRINPFHFTDATQILYLKYSSIKFQAHCLWQFQAPNGFGFKIFIDELTKNDTSHFSISNSDYAFANEKDIKIKFPYYSYNNYLRVNIIENSSSSEFFAYVSIFKLQFDISEANCSIINAETGVKWTNIEKTGYLKNSKCSYKTVVKPNTEIWVKKETMNIEAFVDHIYFYFNEFENVPNDVTGMPALSLFPNSDNTERTVLWEFISDGSVESLGFSLIFEEIPCFCGESLIIVPCQGIRFYDIMNRTDGYYCGNLNCNFTIILDPECENQSEIIRMEITLIPDQINKYNTPLYIYDICRIIADNVTILEISYVNRYRVHTMFLYANSSNIFQVITASDLYAKNIFLNFGVDGLPIDVSTIILTNDKPYFAYHLCENKTPNLFNIELSHKLKLQNASIEMYSTLENIETAILFFSNESITHKMNFENCFADNSDKSSCKTYKTEFSVFHFSDSAYYCSYPIYLLFQSSTHTHGCVFKNNIHNMHYDYKTYPVIVSAMSNNISSCRIFIFPYPLINHITSIWTTPKINGSLKIYAGSESKEFVIIDAASTSSWRDIRLNSDIYIIEIPINAAIVIYVGLPIHSKILDFPYNSIFTSPHFGEPKMELDVVDKNPYMSFEIKNYDVQFSLIEYKLHSQIQFYFIVGGKARINITADFGTKTFPKNTNVDIYYNCFSKTTPCFGQDILFHIKSIKKIETTNSSLTTLTKFETATTKTLNKKSFSSACKIWFPIFLLIVFL